MSTTAPVRRLPLAGTFVVILTGVLAYSILQSLVTPVLPTIQREFHTSQSTVTWALTANLLSASVLTPILGRVGDKVGKKRIFVAALITISFGSLLAALAGSIGVLIIARVIQGAGGGVLPLAFGIIREEFPAEKVSGAVAFAAALTAVGGGLGLVLAGPIVENLGYHWLFWIPLIVCVSATVATYTFIPESRTHTPGPISVIGGLLLSAWLVALLLAISNGPRWGWGSAATLGLLTLGILLAIAWYVAESRSPAPLIDMRMMRRNAVWTTNLVALLFGASMFAAFAYVPAVVQAPESTGYGFGASVSMSGLFLLPLTVCMFLVGTVSARLANLFGAKRVVFTGAALMAGGYAILAFARHQRWEIFVATGIIGIALGLGFAAMANLIVEAVPPEQTGVATGMNANIRIVGGAIGAAVTTTVIAAGVGPDEFPTEAGYTHGFALLTGIAILASLAALLVPAGRRGHVEQVESPHAELALVVGGTLLGSEPE